MADELNEIHEQAEHSRENRELLPITFTLAVLASSWRWSRCWDTARTPTSC